MSATFRLSQSANPRPFYLAIIAGLACAFVIGKAGFEIKSKTLAMASNRGLDLNVSSQLVAGISWSSFSWFVGNCSFYDGWCHQFQR